MARLRIAPVEYKVCRCGTEYEGARCPDCLGRRTPFDPNTMRKIAYDHLIVVGVDPPPYGREPRLRCKARGAHHRCWNRGEPPERLGEKWDNLYDIADVRAYEEWQEHRRLLNDRERLGREAKARGTTVKRLTADLNERASDLARRIFSQRCPLCDARPSDVPSHVWVRTFAGPEPDPQLLDIAARVPETDGEGDEDEP
jgi:hypothetical protein